MKSATRLEPESLVRSFLSYPPEGFTTSESSTGLPMFEATYDVLTTMGARLRARVERWPMYRHWRRWLSPRVVFVGTTVTEYAQLPIEVDADMIIADVMTRRDRHPLLIIKDLPTSSPLLDDASNAHAAAVKRACLRAGFVLVSGQALAYVPIDFSHPDEYVSRRSAGRRKDLRRKLRSLRQLRIDTVPTGRRFDDPRLLEEIHQLYLAVHAQSLVHFDKLTLEFFRVVLTDPDSGGVVFLYHSGAELIGFNLCFVCGDKLIDKYIGLRYPQARELNLYFVSWMHNLGYAAGAGMKYYVAGWTDPQVKRELGASFTWTQHAVYARNPLLRMVLRLARALFENDAGWHRKQRSASPAGT